MFFEPRYTTFLRGTRLILERLATIRINENLSPKEKALYTEVLYQREAALYQDFSKVGRIRLEVAPLQQIRIIPYKLQQVRSLSVLKALRNVVIGIILERLNSRRLEPSYTAYYNPQFLVTKKNGRVYRLINNTTNINRVTIRDSNILPSIDEFANRFARYVFISLVDFFSRYN